MSQVSNWKKFKLLLWKNWVLQWSHKLQLIVELLLPVIFSALLVLIRMIVTAEPKGVTDYYPLSISDLKVFRGAMGGSSFLKSMIKAMAGKASDSVGFQNAWKLPTFELAFSPSNQYVENIVKFAAESLNMTYKSYENAITLEEEIKSGTTFAGVSFDDDYAYLNDYPDNLSFDVRFPSELRTPTINIGLTWLTDRLFPVFDLTGPRNANFEDGGVPVGYLREGFLPIQHAISMAYMKLKSQVTDLPAVELRRYPYPEYIFDPLLQGLSSLMSLIILLSYIYPCTYIAKYITTEKEKQLKEVMKIMGLDNWLHWSAWFVKSFCMLGISAFLITVMMKIKWSDDVAVLTFAAWSPLFCVLLAYTVASICFCFMMATFFSKASTAASVTGLIWFMAYIPFSFAFNKYHQLSLVQKLSMSLLSNTAMGFSFKLILNFEGTGEGLQWSNFFTPVSIDDDLTVGALVLMMLGSAVIYLMICLYIEQIFPGDYGVAKKWNFPFTSHFWCPKAYSAANEEEWSKDTMANRNPQAFEPDPQDKHIGIQVRNLKKKFGERYAVKGVSLNMYEDEITVLLGHNGAGKTTTISMLTGMIPPTMGTAEINGSDIRSNIEGARMSLGICPQHNVLFDDMSVADHIVFFSRLKGLRGQAIQTEVSKYLKMIELEDKANVAASKLSGGMKRKLSLCCALCGDTKVVLCDEPSSGMDPSARRQLWDLLQAEKTGRTILLTTHFMDEADVLGDRIAIMCNGELKCHGTSFFLKKKYGSGYRLICVKHENCSVDEVTAMLRDFVPQIEPECDIGAELSYKLPDAYSGSFEEMFRKLEDNSAALRLNGYGISITSMEEVFMKVGAEHAHDGTQQQAIMNGGAVYADDSQDSVQSDQLFSENQRLLSGWSLSLNQWHAMFLKKLLYTWRNKLLFLIQNFMPIFFVSMTIIISRQQALFNDLKPLPITMSVYPVAVSVLETSDRVTQDSFEYQVAQQYKQLATSFGSSYQLATTGNQSFRDYILDLGKTIQVHVNSRYLASATIAPKNITAWLNNQPFHAAPLTVNMVHNAMARALFGNTTEIKVRNNPLPYSTSTLLTQLNTGNNMGTQLATNICFCMCFVSAFYILFVIKEKQSRSKLLQFVGGVKIWPFWLTQYLWDFLTFTLTAVIVVLTILCFQEQGFSTFEELGRYLAILLIFGASVLPLTYLISYSFTEPATGFARISIFNLFAGMALFITVVIMSVEILGVKDIADTMGAVFRVVPHFSLAMGLNKAYVNVATRRACGLTVLGILPDGLRCQLFPPCCADTPFFAWDNPGILSETVYMAATGITFFAILIILEYGWIGEFIYFIKSKIQKQPTLPEDSYYDDDVEQERQRILAMSADEISCQNLVLDRVTKYYNSFLAVNQISLCVKPVECFGLLGVNGAGKTTTFKMMTGDETISSGAAYLKGMDLKSELNEIYKEIGYCPQFDALLDDLTGRETLKIFCLLRGVPKKRIKTISEELAKSFGFMKHMDKQTKAYSGGNKRKLSTAIAVVGSPSVIYLDEPTTGMDPAARRQLWNMVCHIRDAGKSIVLTSHSMEECEALCTRLAIMVNGEFKCIGSTQHLKNKYSKGLILKIKIKRQQKNRMELYVQSLRDVKNFVQTTFPDAFLKEEYQGILTFYIPLSSIKWSKIFGLMERNRDAMNIEDYSISQTTLEEIFLEFAKYQREDPRAMKVRRKGLSRFLPCRREKDENGDYRWYY